MFDYLTTTFLDRIKILTETLQKTPDKSDIEIAIQLNCSEKLVESQRKFLGLPPLPQRDLPKARVQNKNPTPEVLKAQQTTKKASKRKPNYNRKPLPRKLPSRPTNIKAKAKHAWDSQFFIASLYNAGMGIKNISLEIGVSQGTIRRILGL